MGNTQWAGAKLCEAIVTLKKQLPHLDNSLDPEEKAKLKSALEKMESIYCR